MAAPRLTGQRCECTACGELFRKSSTFTRHRVGSFGTVREPGDRRCLTLAEMQARGWRQDEAGFWRGPRLPADIARKLTRSGQTAAIDTHPLPTQGGAP